MIKMKEKLLADAISVGHVNCSNDYLAGYTATSYLSLCPLFITVFITAYK